MIKKVNFRFLSIIVCTLLTATLPTVAVEASKDVTEVLTAAVKDDKLTITVGNAMFGDPTPGVSKNLHVEFLFGTKSFVREVSESSKLELAAPAGQKLVILKAVYGPSGSASAVTEATPASAIQIHKDFAVERVYSVPRSNGSWVAMCFDDKGRLYVSDQGPGLYRFTPPALGSLASGTAERVSDKWGFSQGMAFINGALYIVQQGDHSEKNFRPESILRIKDTDGDDKLDMAEKLFEFPRVTGDAANWYEHNVHAIALGPDGKSIYVVSGDRNGLPCRNGRTPKHWNRDSWDFKFEKEPYSGGWVMRADLDGQNPEYVCMGLRNSYDIAFNRDGDLFTYDSDLEHDIGMPNYRPAAIRQILSGTDSGWGGRAGEMRWSWNSKWEDIQPPLKNIGPGSPTGVCFGYGAKFPARYQEAFFACDWSYGRMFVVGLAPKGASYTAEAETFLSAQGLPIADLAVSPKDGAMYFLIGGRGTQSGIYRVTYQGNENTAPSKPQRLEKATVAAQKWRRELEAFHGGPNPKALTQLWPQLGHEDRAIRSAARVALEWQPVNQWKQRALNEKESRIALQAILALARSTEGDPAVQAESLAALERFDFSKLGADEQCWYLRILTILATRHGMYSPDVAAKLLDRLEPNLPSSDVRVNEEIVALSAALHGNGFISKTLDLFEQSRTQEEQILYTQALISSAGSAVWTPRLRERFFNLAIDRVPHWKGGYHVKPLRDGRLNAIVAMLTEDQRKRFADRIAAAQKPPAIMPVTSRRFVKQWKIEEFTAALEAGLRQKRDLENGRALFNNTGCIACHNFRGEGGIAGPDLSSAGGRYTPRDLLDNILNPSKVINEQNAINIYTMNDGSRIEGRTVNLSGDTVMVATNPLDPGGSEVRFSVKDLKVVTRSSVSLMPEGLLDTVTEGDLLDLLAFLTQPVTGRVSEADRSGTGTGERK